MLSNYLLSQLTVHVCFPALLEINLTYSSLLHDHHYRTIKASASILFPKAIWCYVQTFKLIMIIIIIMISNYHQCSKKMSLNFLRLLTCLQNLCQNPGFRISLCLRQRMLDFFRQEVTCTESFHKQYSSIFYKTVCQLIFLLVIESLFPFVV